MTLRTSTISLFALSFLAIAPPAAAGRVSTKEVTKQVEPYLKAKRLRAVSVAVIQDGKTWTGHFGSISDKNSSSPNDSTVYEIGSISKVFTSLMLADEVVNGKLKLDQTIGSILPVVRKMNPSVGNAVQLIHLSTHRAGFPSMPKNFSPADASDPFKDYSKLHLDAALLQLDLERPVDSERRYSNYGAGTLGYLLTRHTKKSYEELLQKKIAGPLGLGNTSSSSDASLATPHTGYSLVTKPWHFQSLAGAGAIKSTLPDMAAFARAMLNPPSGRTGEAIELAWKQHRNPDLSSADRKNLGQPQNEIVLPPSHAMGLGWHMHGETRWHNGQTGGFHSMILVNRKERVAVVVLANVAEPMVDALAKNIFKLAQGKTVDPPEVKTSQLKALPEVTVSRKTMKRLEGKYRLAPGFAIDVWIKDGGLVAQATAQQPLPLYPISDTKWRYRTLEAELEFELSGSSPADSVTLHQNGNSTRGSRSILVGDNPIRK